KVVRDAEISLAGTEHWKRLGNIGALAPFFRMGDKAHKKARTQVPPSTTDKEAAPSPIAPIAQPSSADGPLVQEFAGLAPMRPAPGPQLPSVIVEGFYDRPEPRKSLAGSMLLLLSILLLGVGGYFGYMQYWQPQKLREEAVTRESAQAAEAERQREEAAALQRFKAAEEARAKAAREAEREEEATQAASNADAG